MKTFSSYEKSPRLPGHFAFEERLMVNLQVSLLNLTLDAGIPGDVDVVTYRTESILCLCRIMTDCLWIGLIIAWMRG